MKQRQHRYRRVVAAVYGTPWAILPSKLQEIADLIELRAAGVRLTAAEVAARIGAASQPALRQSNGRVAVMNLFGTFFPRADALTQHSGGISAETFATAFQGAVDDAAVSAIVLNVDSPGGAVPGIEEAADVVFAARGVKPVYAIANQQMASAAYWIGAQAEKVYATPSAVAIGSIGVLGMHRDQSAADEQAGLKYSIFTSAPNKAEGNPHQPLSESAREYFQTRVDAIHGKFLAAVARGRGVSAQTVSETFGQGRALLADEALARRMVDRVATLDDLLEQLGADGSPAPEFPDRHQPAFPSAIAASADDPRFLSVRELIG